MTPRARLAHQAFAALAAEEGGSAYFGRFLQSGLQALPNWHRERFLGLTDWTGVESLKASLQRLAFCRSGLPVLLANRSAQLLKLAARTLFHPCRNVLTTDLDWPGYRDILLDECRRANRTLTVVPLRHAINIDGVGADEVVERVRGEYARHGCDGLFLTALSSDGVRLPVDKIVTTLEASHHVRFVVLDGAQDFCHAGANLRHCDLYLTGAHKWLGACLPLGIGFYGRKRSKGRIETVMNHMIASGDLDDPLLRYSSLPGCDAPGQVAETVNLTPLFTCQGAATDAISAATDTPSETLASRLQNLDDATTVALRAGWEPVIPVPALRSGILLLRPPNRAIAGVPPEVLRNSFRDLGVALSTYAQGMVRLSMPQNLWTEGERNTLGDALCSVRVAFA